MKIVTSIITFICYIAAIVIALSSLTALDGTRPIGVFILMVITSIGLYFIGRFFKRLC